MSVPPEPRFEDAVFEKDPRGWISSMTVPSIGLPPPVEVEVKLTPQGEQLLKEMSDDLSRRLEQELASSQKPFLASPSEEGVIPLPIEAGCAWFSSSSPPCTAETLKESVKKAKEVVDESKAKEAQAFLQVWRGGYSLVVDDELKPGQIGISRELFAAIKKEALKQFTHSPPKEKTL